MAVTSFGLDVRFGPLTACQVLLNGVTISAKPAGDAEAHSLAIQHEVVPGQNQVEFRVGSAEIGPDSGANIAVPDADGFFLEAELEMESAVEFEEHFEVTTTPLEELEWRPEGSITLPHREYLTFTAPSGTSRPAWQDGAPVSEGEVGGQVLQVLSQLRDALISKDLGRYQELMEVRNKDMALAYPLNGDSHERAAIDSQMIAELLAGDPQFAPLEPGLDITTEADGRLVLATTKSGQAPLRLQPFPGGEVVELPIAFASIEGVIRPIR